jgi:hypothetical protein
LKQGLLIGVINWQVDDGLDTFSSVPGVDLFHVSSSLLDFYWCLKVHNGSDSLSGNLVHVRFKEWVWPDDDS